MIPLTPSVFLTEAKYTKLFKDITIPQSLNSYIIQHLTIDNINFGSQLITEISVKYRFYEICTEDEEVFWQCYVDTFDEYYEYYLEYLKQYIKNKNIEELFIRSHERHDETSRWGSETGTASMSDSEQGTTSGTVETSKEGNESSSVSGTESVTSSGTNTVEKSGSSTANETDKSDTNTDRTVRDYDLPNHVVSATSEDGYLTSKTKEGTGTTNESEKDTSESHEDTETGTSSNTTSKQDASTTERTSGESTSGTTSGTSSSSSSGTASTSGESSGGSDYDMSTRTIDPKDFYKVKKEILDMVRNVIHEFADKFEDCFLHVF